MRSEFSSENLLFILSALKFKASFPAINPINSPQIREAAKHIYAHFVSHESLHQVNLSAEVAQGMNS